MRRGIPSLFKDGSKNFTGLEDVILKNVDACQGLSKITRTSLGPNGMNKMVINHLEKLFVTSDAATIIRELEVEHPAAKVICEAAAMQEREIGDGSNFVVVFAGELLKKAEELIYMGLHPSDIVSGYTKAFKKSIELLESNELTIASLSDAELRERKSLAQAIQPAIASKQYGYEAHLATIIADACITAMPNASRSFNVDNVRICKMLGGRISDSDVVRGMVIPRQPLGSVRSIEDGKVAVFTCSVDSAQTETKGTVLLKSAEDLLNYNVGEEMHIEKIIQQYADMGVKVVITGEKIGEMAHHYLEKHGILMIKLGSKFMLRRICRTVGARPLVQLTGAKKEDFGHIARVRCKEMGGGVVTIFEQAADADTQVATVVVRGSTNDILDDVERAVDDGVNRAKTLGRDSRLVAGAGAVEMEMARRIQAFGESATGLDQYAIKKFAEALEVIPRVLAENAGLNDNDFISKLYAAHENDDGAKIGIDIENKEIGNMADREGQFIRDTWLEKNKAIHLAATAAITILRVDQIIMSKLAGGPKKPTNRGHWDDQ